MTGLKLSLMIVVAVGAVACTEDIDSTDVRTSGVYADMEVLATGNGQSTVEVGLKTGGSASNTFLEIKGDDELVATANGTAKALTQTGSYAKTVFDTEAAGTEFIVSFMRGPDDESAPNSTATLPEPFSLSGLSPGDEISRASSLNVTWAPGESTDAMRWELDGDCMFETRDSLADAGSLEVAPADYSVHSGKEQETCDAELCVFRVREGLVDPAYGEGGDFDAIQRRCVAFVSTP